jgi:hypothetical protein
LPCCSLIAGVVDGLAGLYATVIVAQRVLVEGLGLVEAQAVKSAHLIGVSVLLSGP